MAKMVKGAKRYLLLRGRDENGDDIVIDIFSKKELDVALKEGRVTEEDHVVKVELMGKIDLKRPGKSKKRRKSISHSN
ncbi:MAG: hypothetical protein JRE24_09895 [Deltaproteobacteria bacterium]|nr:hypothetical protein [Deltaproteobacteria bacterium]